MADRRSKADDPPNSRLFIVHPKCLKEDDFRKEFEAFGTIEDIYTVKDRNGEPKGVTYIKFSRTSAAAKAMEGMNGKYLVSGFIKVMVAASKEEGSRRDINESESLQRLFVVVPKSLTDNELREHFSRFGEVEYAAIVRDRDTKESKGCAFVKYYKFSHAATALEECDKSYKAIFAAPRPTSDQQVRGGGGGGSGGGGRSWPGAVASSLSSLGNSFSNALPPPTQFKDNGYTRLLVTGAPILTEEQMYTLFDIVPTLDYCNVTYEGDRRRPMKCVAEVSYEDARWASYAKQKFHGFEYPPGARLIVRPDFEKRPSSKRTAEMAALEKAKPDLLQIAETIAQATSLIQAAGIAITPDLLAKKLTSGNLSDETPYACNVRLPEPEPMLDINEQCNARCFIVCQGPRLANTILKDVFCRFANLIDVYIMHNKNFGFAKFATKSSADLAIKTLNGCEINETRLKVIEAEEEKSEHKRLKIDDSNE